MVPRQEEGRERRYRVSFHRFFFVFVVIDETSIKLTCPASIIAIERVGSALANRPAITDPAAPPETQKKF